MGSAARCSSPRGATIFGAASTAQYETVSSGRTGHAESVKITFDPRQVSYGRILQIYFSVAHNPTELNRQGPDTGTQYRSAIFAINHRRPLDPLRVLATGSRRPRAYIRPCS